MNDGSGSGLPASMAAAWGVQQRPTKGPKPGLGLDRIVSTAVRVADAEGLAAISMKRVAEELGSSPMSLYRYVAAKDELLALMVDAAFGRPPAPAEDEDWRAGLSRWAWAHLAAVRGHPWTLRIPIEGPPLAPNQIAWFEDALRSLGTTGLAEAEKASIVLMLSGYVRNQATTMADVTVNFLSAAGTPNDAMSGYAELLRTLTDAERFPALHRLLAAGVFDRADPPDDEFAFGLQRILDGIEALVRVRAPARSERTEDAPRSAR
jgi:AcrR family transcriptional regulator